MIRVVLPAPLRRLARLDGEVETSRRAVMIPDRYDMSKPENQRKLEAADALAQVAEEAGLSLIQLAIAWVIRNPAVTAAIIGPRTMEHLESQLDVVKVSLAKDVLDRIDEIVPPGTTINEADRGYAPPALTDGSLRRRSA